MECAIWLLTLFEHAQHSLRSIGLSVVMNVIMMIVCTFSLSMLSTVLVPIISTRVSIIPKSESTSAYNKEQLRLKEEAKVQERIDSLETQIQAKDIELDKFRSISLLNVRVTHKQYGTGIVIAQKENTIKVRFPEGLEKSFIIHTKFPARPTFEDDEQVVEAFTEYDRLTREIQGLKKLLEIEKAKVQTTIL